MTIRVIDSDMAAQILAERHGSGLILSALNLFMLGFLKNHPEFPKNSLFWCDGMMGAKFLRAKGAAVKQLRGVDMLKAVLAAHQGRKVGVIGSCSDAARHRLESLNITVADHFILDAFQEDRFDPAGVCLTSDVAIITLPSPKQELLALKLAALERNAKVHFYCIGGALNMLSAPELDCPRVLQKLGLEFVFRLRTDTRRRMRRLLDSAILACLNWASLRGQEVDVVRTLAWRQLHQ